MRRCWKLLLQLQREWLWGPTGHCHCHCAGVLGTFCFACLSLVLCASLRCVSFLVPALFPCPLYSTVEQLVSRVITLMDLEALPRPDAFRHFLAAPSAEAEVEAEVGAGSASNGNSCCSMPWHAHVGVAAIAAAVGAAAAVVTMKLLRD
jgi:hypothetical protein